jgi:hypothetical protein
MINITPQQLRKAADLQEKIQSLQAELGQLLGGSFKTPAIEAAEAPKKKRKISAAGIARIVAATKARWARIHAASASAKPAPTSKKKISAAGIARIRAAQNARWAKIKAAQGVAKPAPQPKRKFSAAGRARLAALAKARWAKAKKAGKSRL